MPSISESPVMLGFARWQAVVDFVGLAVAFYVLLRWSRAARALRITLAIVSLHALALAAYHWGLLITSWLLDGLAGLAVLLVLVVFQPELRRLFTDFPPPIELPAEQQRWYFFNAYSAFVDRSCRLAPIVAVFEDLHWADEATLQTHIGGAVTVQSVAPIADWPRCFAIRPGGHQGGGAREANWPCDGRKS